MSMFQEFCLLWGDTIEHGVFPSLKERYPLKTELSLLLLLLEVLPSVPLNLSPTAP